MSRHHYYKMLSEEDKRTFNQWARVSLTVWMMGLGFGRDCGRECPVVQNQSARRAGGSGPASGWALA